MVKNLSNGLGACAIVAVLTLSPACDGAAARERTVSNGHAVVSPLEADSMGAALTEVRTVPMKARRELTENSAAVMSPDQPGVLFTINDSGNDPLLFAIDTLGRDRGVWPVNDATNVDWESASMGPCGTASPREAHCTYIGDTGDNRGHHDTRTIYRVQEPRADSRGDLIASERVVYKYADGPRDVEAMYVAGNGDMFLITKRGVANSAGRLRQALVFRLPASVWNSRQVATAMVTDSLPIVPGSALLRQITDASLSGDGKHLAVRTYMQVYVFATDPGSGRVNASVRPSVCNIGTLGEAQGEGVTWANNAGRLVFTSEGRKSPLHLGNCALPK
jgi:hypothetical protein